ncbi:MAG: CoB--CoM heterodisulfide reductase iron-sulfur subunit C [Promethearchaeota archaeon]|nr:MAG: CoB--CoM heterodisulfide reductase iron-sulfur subunit C [Candidatus Lokiarchaeota archaeon]
MVVDFEFRKQVMDYHQGSDVIKYCYQCNRCTDNCPVSYATDEFYQYKYNPRSNILNALLGYKENIFGVDEMAIWGCTVCDTCDEVCPQNIELTEVFTLLKNQSIAKGRGPEFIYQQAGMIYENGKAIPMQSAIERRRQDLGLPDIMAPNTEELQSLLNNMKLNQKLKSGE